jgi:DNA uptake protein ComE-like DNA-binding protein
LFSFQFTLEHFMNYKRIQQSAIAAALLIGSALCFGADSKAPTASEPTAVSNPKAVKAAAKAEAKAAAAKVKLVNINGASKDELKTLPGIDDALAAKIIAGRPYGSKAHLVTRKVIDAGQYESVRGLVIALQPKAAAPSPVKK